MLILLASSVVLASALNDRLQAYESRLVDIDGLMKRITGLESEIRRLNSELEGLKRSSKPPIVAIRIDDVQDFAFRDAQLYMLRYNTAKGIPASLAVIPDLLESDNELIAEISDALRIGAEVSAHGWGHENLTKLTLEEQEQRLLEAKASLRRLFGVNTTVLIPPMFSYNNDTLAAMKKTGYGVISSSIELQKPGVEANNIVRVPATVEFSDFVNGTWRAKSVEGLLLEVELSIIKYGYAVIVLHPQELMNENELDNEALRIYNNLLNLLSERYSFTVIKDLSELVAENIN